MDQTIFISGISHHHSVIWKLFISEIQCAMCILEFKNDQDQENEETLILEKWSSRYWKWRAWLYWKWGSWFISWISINAETISLNLYEFSFQGLNSVDFLNIIVGQHHLWRLHITDDMHFVVWSLSIVWSCVN